MQPITLREEMDRNRGPKALKLARISHIHRRNFGAIVVNNTKITAPANPNLVNLSAWIKRDKFGKVNFDIDLDWRSLFLPFIIWQIYLSNRGKTNWEALM